VKLARFFPAPNCLAPSLIRPLCFLKHLFPSPPSFLSVFFFRVLPLPRTKGGQKVEVLTYRHLRLSDLRLLPCSLLPPPASSLPSAPQCLSSEAKDRAKVLAIPSSAFVPPDQTAPPYVCFRHQTQHGCQPALLVVSLFLVLFPPLQLPFSPVILRVRGA